MKSHILFYRNGLEVFQATLNRTFCLGVINGQAIWHGLPDIRILNLIMADSQRF